MAAGEMRKPGWRYISRRLLRHQLLLRFYRLGYTEISKIQRKDPVTHLEKFRLIGKYNLKTLTTEWPHGKNG
ncbi:MAG: hypothetical protein PHE26_13650 [Syntrophomonadaceae bacterium]|nr:hypothetical protein [Syntrophomonadaceae bacterium]